MQQGYASSFSHSEFHRGSPMDLITVVDLLGIYSSSNRPLAFSYSVTDLINFYLYAVSQATGNYSLNSLTQEAC